jgi:hypothetical protein
MKQTSLGITALSMMLSLLVICLPLGQSSPAQPASSNWQQLLQQAIQKRNWPAAKAIIVAQPEQSQQDISLAAMQEIAQIEDDQAAKKLFEQALYFIDKTSYGKGHCPPSPFDKIYSQRFSADYYQQRNLPYVSEDSKYENAAKEVDNILRSIKTSRSKSNYKNTTQKLRQVMKQSPSALEFRRSIIRALDTCPGIGDGENADRQERLLKYLVEIESRMVGIVTVSIKLNAPDIAEIALEHSLKSADRSGIDYRKSTLNILDKIAQGFPRSTIPRRLKKHVNLITSQYSK